MSRERKRRRGGKRPPVETPGGRYLRQRLPDGSLGGIVPIVLYPRYSTIAGDGFARDVFDVAALRQVPMPRSGTMTIRVEETTDTDAGWNDRPSGSGRTAETSRGRDSKARRKPAHRRSGPGRTKGRRVPGRRGSPQGRGAGGGKG